MTRHAIRCGALFCAALTLYCAALGQSTLWSRDETLYADIARHMERSGEWLTLWWDGRPWFNHPPLFYWLVALDFRLLGVSEFAARLPAAVFGSASVALVYAWASTFLRPRGAIFAALALMLNLQYFLESRLAIIDSMFLFFLSLSMLGFWSGWQGKRGGYALLFVGCGLACLAKGPWGLVFPFVVIVPFAALTGRLERLKALPWIWGLPLALAVGGAWYAVEIARHGEAFSRVVLGYYFLGRITLEVERQGGPVWLYLPVLLAGFMPWSFLLPQALRDLWHRRGADEIAPFLLCWIVVPLVGLSLASTKLPSYAAFVFTPCALAVGAFLDRCDRRRLAPPFALAALLSLGIVGVLRTWGHTHIAAPPGAFEGAEIGFMWMGGGLLLAVFAALAPTRLPSPAGLAATGALGCLLSVALIVFPALEPERSLHSLAQAVRAQGPAPLAIHGPGVFGVIFYADRGPMRELLTEDEVRDWIGRFPGGRVVMRAATLERLSPDLAERLVVVAATGREVIARTR